MPKKKIPSVGQVPRKDEPLFDAREEEFCQLYSFYRNGARAYRIAFKTKGIKTHSLSTMACRLLNKVEIQGRVAALDAQHLEKIIFTKERLLAEMAALAFAPIDKSAKMDYWAKMRAMELLAQTSGVSKNANGLGQGDTGEGIEAKRSGLREALRRKAGG